MGYLPSMVAERRETPQNYGLKFLLLYLPDIYSVSEDDQRQPEPHLVCSSTSSSVQGTRSGLLRSEVIQVKAYYPTNVDHQMTDKFL